jgi:hypothetical protein
MQWTPDSTAFYLLMQEDCSRFNIPRTAIVKVGTDLGAPQVILENPGADFSSANCYDEVEQEYVVGDPVCVVAISEMALAPTGATLVFAASSPRREFHYELYTIDAAGLRPKEVMTDELESVVQSLQLREELE